MRFRNLLSGTTILSAGALAVLTNCTGTTKSDKGAPSAHVLVAALARAESCDDLLAKIQADAIVRLDYMAKQALEASANQGTIGTGGAVVGRDDSSGEPSAPSAGAGDFNSGAGGTTSAGGSSFGGSTSVGEPTNGGAEGGSAGTASSSGGSTSGEASGSAGTGGTPTHSDTNTQVEGVDEADIVKTDGSYIYLLHGTKFFALTSWPAEATAIQSNVPIEGDPREMFVKDGKAVVFSAVYDAALYPTATTGGVAAPVPDYYYGYGGTPFTKITVIDASNTAAPVVLRESYIEGDYVSSRLHGSIVRAVMQNGFKVPQFSANIQYTDPWGNPYSQEEIAVQIDTWKELMTSAIQSTTLEDWLPIERQKVNGELVTVAQRCGDYYVPDPGLTQQGLTAIVSLNLNDVGAKFDGATILGNASTVYANESSLVLAHNDWRWDVGEIDSQQIALHRFDISGADTQYNASGFVPGYIHNQFSIDEKAGVIRLSTTQQTRTETTSGDAVVVQPGQTINRVLTVAAEGDVLGVKGSTGGFGEGETIYATRFVGDRGYVVTYRQTDPLFVVDVADVAHPKLLGQAQIPGLSEYMHPLDDTHLLTIGRAGDQTGAVLGFQLQIFDVSNPTAPQRTVLFTYQPDGSSEASYNHKAFTYYPEKNLLAFPYVSYGYPYRSSLEVFRVTTQEITQLGSIDHTGLLASSCGYVVSDPYFSGCYNYTSNEVRRGLFVEDFVYSISYGGVLVHSMADLINPVATVLLPAPEYYTYYYGGGVGGVAVPPSAGGAAGAPATGTAGAGGTVSTGGTGGIGGVAAGGTAPAVCDPTLCPAPTSLDGGTIAKTCCVYDTCGLDYGDGLGCQTLAL